VQWLAGNGGSFDVSDAMTETLTDANSKKYAGYSQSLLTYPGVSVGSTQSVVRIKEVGASLTDDHIFDALALFPGHKTPDAIFAHRDSINVLRKSRTATNATGSPAPTPTDVAGIPLVVTESL